MLAAYLPHPQSCHKLTDLINAIRRTSPDLPTPALPNMASLTSALFAMVAGDRIYCSDSGCKQMASVAAFRLTASLSVTKGSTILKRKELEF